MTKVITMFGKFEDGREQLLKNLANHYDLNIVPIYTTSEVLAEKDPSIFNYITERKIKRIKDSVSIFEICKIKFTYSFKDFSEDKINVLLCIDPYWLEDLDNHCEDSVFCVYYEKDKLIRLMNLLQKNLFSPENCCSSFLQEEFYDLKAYEYVKKESLIINNLRELIDNNNFLNFIEGDFNDDDE